MKLTELQNSTEVANGIVILGDCLEVMKSIDSGSIDAIICDPPYW